VWSHLLKSRSHALREYMINKGKHKLYYTIYLRGSAPWFSKKIKVNSGPHNHANIQSQKKEQELCIRKVKNRELYAM